ncbi:MULTISPECIES: DUF2239 family protein [unclassified Chelatococcus]|jgi:hypothetical protein|uniref:DUF2239 family protein n=1 Tax=unclassified Chelatococcus TaxID=2638111 RepID=UPI001BCE6D90|nr:MULTISPECIES: DUF2239 family protein [unclassified Chelatococcus]CAH1673496.1 conserved hypothetical protein [Hyphomicrobiales bacterium]MBS7738815.1 DUF2239 family protein [Chelatococcus sp. HY11]MBX3547284.1 DUF2239 family protein [Chelatococcus sp.]MCO5076654.1 DUF2239 family protein [Chelatococcus sp.]CAH1674248.1 conserved hypothetical protein [Hyphomicrobiales bacterium]
MSQSDSSRLTAFDGGGLLARGARVDVALAVHAAVASNPDADILTFDDMSGQVVDLDLRGSASDVVGRYAATAVTPDITAPSVVGERGRGRPKLGVVAREVTLLPRHWDWLATQPGGASQTLRRLVEAARRDDDGQAGSRAGRDRAYRFMATMAGNWPGFEEAARALFKPDRAQFEAITRDWPVDVRQHIGRLAWGDTSVL